MKKFLSMLLLVAILATSVAALAQNWKFTKNAYCYKSAGHGKTQTVIAKGSVAEGKLGTNWVKITLSNGKKVYVKKSTVKKTDADVKIKYAQGGTFKSKEDGEEEEASGKKVKATGNVKIRSKACLDSNVLGTLKKGKTLKFKGATKKDDRGVAFYKVSYNGKTAWVSSLYSKIVK